MATFDILDIFFYYPSLSTLGVLKERVTFFTLLQEFRRALCVLGNVRVLTGEVTGAAGIMFVSFHSPSTQRDQNWHRLEILRQTGQLINNPPKTFALNSLSSFSTERPKSQSLLHLKPFDEVVYLEPRLFSLGVSGFARPTCSHEGQLPVDFHAASQQVASAWPQAGVGLIVSQHYSGPLSNGNYM